MLGGISCGSTAVLCARWHYSPPLAIKCGGGLFGGVVIVITFDHSHTIGHIISGGGIVCGFCWVFIGGGIVCGGSAAAPCIGVGIVCGGVVIVITYDHSHTIGHIISGGVGGGVGIVCGGVGIGGGGVCGGVGIGGGGVCGGVGIVCGGVSCISSIKSVV